MTEQPPPPDDPANEPTVTERLEDALAEQLGSTAMHLHTAGQPEQPTLDQVQQFVHQATVALDAGYVLLMWTRKDGKPSEYMTSHNFPTWVDAARWVQPTVNKMLADERREKGGQIILASGAGHPRRIPR